MVWTRNHLLQNGKYKIEKVLGIGGFGITYLARCKELGRVVIKTLNDAVQTRSDFDQLQDDFLNEALRIRGCQHPQIVKVHKLFQEKVKSSNSDNGSVHSCHLVCIVMEFIQGINLAQILTQQGALAEADAVRYIRQVGEALTVVHDNGLLHRDVKPSNIMVRQATDQAVLIDFGIAREFAPNQTRTHTRSVTAGYAPIEQYERQAKRGSFTDVYALAATLYALVTADVPPEAQARELHWLKYQRDLLQPPQEKTTPLSDRLNAAIMKGMAIRAEYRPKSMAEWLELLPDQPQVDSESEESEARSPLTIVPSPDTDAGSNPQPISVVASIAPNQSAALLHGTHQPTTLPTPEIKPTLHHQTGYSPPQLSQPAASPLPQMTAAPVSTASPFPSSKASFRMPQSVFHNLLTWRNLLILLGLGLVLSTMGAITIGTLKSYSKDDEVSSSSEKPSLPDDGQGEPANQKQPPNEGKNSDSSSQNSDPLPDRPIADHPTPPTDVSSPVTPRPTESSAGVTADKPPKKSEEPSVLPPPAPDPASSNGLNLESAKTLLRSWFEAKQQAMGPNYDTRQLDNVLTGELLTHWQAQVDTAQENDF